MANILVIDDHEDNLLSLKAMISDLFSGIGIQTAADGTEGIELAKAHPPDVILLDILMPGMDGFEVCRILKEDETLGDIPVVFLTALGENRANKARALEVGAEGFLAKPVDENELVAQIKAMLKIKMADDSKESEKQRLEKLVVERTEKLEEELRRNREMSKKLGESESKYRLLIENLNEGLWYIDQDARTTFVNPPMAEMLGYTVVEMSGKHLFEFMDERGAEIARHNLERRRQGIEEQHEFEFIRKDGSRIYTLLETAPIMDDEGRYAGAVAGVLDITARKLAEEKLKESEERFTLAMKASNDGLFDWNLLTNGIYYSPGWKKMLGYEDHELPNDFSIWETTTDPEDVRISWELQKKLISKQVDRFVMEFKMRHKDGHWVDILSRAEAIFDENGKAIRIVGTHTDITARKQAEVALRESEEKLRAVLDATPFPVAVVDLEDNNILYWSRSAQALFGHTAPTAPEWYQIAYPNPDYRQDVIKRWKPFLVEASNSGKPVNTGEYRVTCKDGSIRICELYATLTEDNLIVTFNDITSRKRAEEALRESEERLRVLSEAAHEAIAIHEEGVLLHANDQYFKMFGYEPGEALGKQMMSMTVAPEAMEFTKKQIATGALGPYESIGVRRDGTRFPIEIQARNVVYKGRHVRFTAIVNITERKAAEAEQQRLLEQVERDRGALLSTLEDQRRAEEALRESERRLADIIQFLPDATLAIDLDKRIIIWNKAIEEMTGIPAAEMISQGDYAYTVPFYGERRPQLMDLVFEDSEETAARYPAITREGDTLTTEVFCKALYSGKGAWVLAKAAPLYDASGRIIGAIEIIRDITMIKRAEDDLRQERQRLEGILRGTNAGTWEWNVQTGETVFNERWADIIGYTMNELSPVSIETWERLCHPDDLKISGELLERHFRGDLDYYECETRMLHKSGGWVWVLDRGRVITWTEDGKPLMVMGTHQDITERRKAEGEILRLNEELEQRVIERTAQLEASNKELEAFSYSVSHDLRAPLRAIDGYIGILLEDFGPRLDDGGKHACSVISKNARRMGKLIDDLLAFSRIGRTDLQFSPIDMEHIVNSTFLELTTPEDRERIDFHVARLPRALGDPNLIRQAWINLLGNAVKFSSKKERAVIEVRAEQQGDEVVYSIRDNGAGFDMRYADKLFGVFQRLHNDRDFEGTGVGLAILSRIILRHGGRVWTEGETDQGATFYFSMKRGA